MRSHRSTWLCIRATLNVAQLPLAALPFFAVSSNRTAFIAFRE